MAVTGGFLLFAWLLLDQLNVLATRPLYAIAFTIMAVTGTLGVLFDQLSTVLRRGDQALVRGVSTGLGTLALIVMFPKLFDSKSALALLLAWAGGNSIPVLVGIWQIHRSVPDYRLSAAN